MSNVAFRRKQIDHLDQIARQDYEKVSQPYHENVRQQYRRNTTEAPGANDDRQYEDSSQQLDQENDEQQAVPIDRRFYSKGTYVGSTSGLDRSYSQPRYQPMRYPQDDDHPPTPGFFEYLYTLIDRETGKCRRPGKHLVHGEAVDRLMTDKSSSRPNLYTLWIPKRLCLFSEYTSADVELLSDFYYIDTENLCLDCYQAAFGCGFNVWSTTYWDEYDRTHDQDIDDKTGLPANTTKRTRYPQMFNVSTMEARWPRKPEETAGKGIPRWPRLSGSTVSHECWRWLVWMHAPFYIDQLCIDPPYDTFLKRSDPRAKAEGHRVSMENHIAYLGARYGIIVMIPPEFGKPEAIQELGRGYLPQGEIHWLPRLFSKEYFEAGPDGEHLAKRTFTNVDIVHRQQLDADRVRKYFNGPDSTPNIEEIEDVNQRKVPPTKAFMYKRNVAPTLKKKNLENYKQIMKDINHMGYVEAHWTPSLMPRSRLTPPHIRRNEDWLTSQSDAAKDFRKRYNPSKYQAYYPTQAHPLRPIGQSLPARAGGPGNPPNDRHYNGASLTMTEGDYLDVYTLSGILGGEKNPFEMTPQERVAMLGSRNGEEWIGRRPPELVREEQCVMRQQGLGFRQ